MDLDLLFRVTFGLAMAVSIAISSYHRILARRASGTIPRTAEGPLAVALRLLMTLPALATIGAYLFAPAWLRWAQFDVAFGVRMAAACVVAIVPLLVLWVFTSIGSNISETVLTKTRHTLVTHGPYRWVRHPLYAVALLAQQRQGRVAGPAVEDQVVPHHGEVGEEAQQASPGLGGEEHQVRQHHVVPPVGATGLVEHHVPGQGPGGVAGGVCCWASTGDENTNAARARTRASRDVKLRIIRRM